MDPAREQRLHSSSPSSPSLPLIGALLVHGLNGNRSDMVENILLPGHGSHVRDMLPLGWDEWSTAVKREVSSFKQRCEHVFLIGHSLGAALCLHVAAHEEVAGVVSMCAPLDMSTWLRSAVNIAQHITPFVPTLREDIRNPAARRKYTRDVYRWTPMAPVASMLKYLPQLRQELLQVMAPVLVIAAVHDHVVPVRDGYEIYRLLGSQEKQLVTLHRSYHVVMKDHDQEEVFARTLAFIKRYTNVARPQSVAFDDGQQDKLA